MSTTKIKLALLALSLLFSADALMAGENMIKTPSFHFNDTTNWKSLSRSTTEYHTAPAISRKNTGCFVISNRTFAIQLMFCFLFYIICKEDAEHRKRMQGKRQDNKNLFSKASSVPE